MQNINKGAARSPPERRASPAAQNTTAEPPLRSGFGLLIDGEHRLRDSLAECSGRIEGNQAANVERILQHQQKQVDANIALLQQRYEGISTGQIGAESNQPRPTCMSDSTTLKTGDILRDLGRQLANLMTDIDGLVERAPDGQRGELILAEVRRHHEEMAWILKALLSEDETAARFEIPTAASDTAHREQENWDNEGGPIGNASPAR
jgi:hypothetical protein